MHERADLEALRPLGWGALSPGYWAVALDLQRERVGETYAELIELPRDSTERAEAFRRLHIDAHFLLIALKHVLDSLGRSSRVLRDQRALEIESAFESKAPWIRHFRDVVEHLDEYAVGKGRLQASGAIAANTGPLLVFDPLGPPLEVFVQLGSWRLPLRQAAAGGSQLARHLAEIWEEHLGPEEPRSVWGRTR